jgi:hypothetical protein
MTSIVDLVRFELEAGYDGDETSDADALNSSIRTVKVVPSGHSA